MQSCHGHTLHDYSHRVCRHLTYIQHSHRVCWHLSTHNSVIMQCSYATGTHYIIIATGCADTHSKNDKVMHGA